MFNIVCYQLLKLVTNIRANIYVADATEILIITLYLTISWEQQVQE